MVTISFNGEGGGNEGTPLNGSINWVLSSQIFS